MNPPRSRRSRPTGEVWMTLKDRRLLARLMAIQGYSQRKLAADAGFASHSYLGRLLAGKVKTCTADRAVAIAACLQVPLDSLFVSNLSNAARQRGARRVTAAAAEGTFRRGQERAPA